MTTEADAPPVVLAIAEDPAVLGLDQHQPRDEATPRTSHNKSTTIQGFTSSPSNELEEDDEKVEELLPIPRSACTTSTKRRHSTVAVSWEELARRGSRFKSFFQDATLEMIEQYTNKRFKPHHHHDKENTMTTNSTTTTTAATTDQSSSLASNIIKNNSHPGFDHLNKLVEENYVENMQLRRVCNKCC